MERSLGLRTHRVALPESSVLICILLFFFFAPLVLSHSFYFAAQPECQSCPPATFSPPGYKNCSTKSLQCEPGFCVNTTWCLPCPAGYVNDQDNATACIECPDGKVAVPPAIKCLSCRAGQTSSSDHTHCVPCAAGFFNPSVAGTCQPCPVGTYSSRQSLHCTPCPSGSYNNVEGQGGCRECPSGYYCPEGSASARECPGDHACAAGSAEPTSCQPLFTASPGSSTCLPSTVFYVVIGISAGLLVLLCAGGWVAVLYRRPLWKRIKKAYRRRQLDYLQPPPAAAPGGDTKPLIPEPLPGPVYAGL